LSFAHELPETSCSGKFVRPAAVRAPKSHHLARDVPGDRV